MVVLWRTHLRHYDMPSKNRYRHVSDADMRQEVPNQHHSWGNASVQPFHYLFPIPDDLPMPSCLILLDAEPESSTRSASPGRRVVYPKRYHCRLDLRTWSLERRCRLDTGHPTNLSGMEFEHESPNQVFGSSHSSSWSCVRRPFSIYFY